MAAGIDRMKALAGLLGDDTDDDDDDLFGSIVQNRRNVFEKKQPAVRKMEVNNAPTAVAAVVPKKLGMATPKMATPKMATPKVGAATPKQATSTPRSSEKETAAILSNVAVEDRVLAKQLADAAQASNVGKKAKPRSRLGQPRLPAIQTDCDAVVITSVAVATPISDYIGEVVPDDSPAAQDIINNAEDIINSDNINNDIVEDDDGQVVFGRPQTFGAAGGLASSDSVYMPNVRERASAIADWKIFKKEQEKNGNKDGHARAMKWRVDEGDVSRMNYDGYLEEENVVILQDEDYGLVGGFGSAKKNKNKAPPSFLAHFEPQQEEEEPQQPEQDEYQYDQDGENVVNGVPTNPKKMPSSPHDMLSPRIKLINNNNKPSFLSHFDPSPRNDDVIPSASPRQALSPRNGAVYSSSPAASLGNKNGTPSPRNGKVRKTTKTSSPRQALSPRNGVVYANSTPSPKNSKGKFFGNQNGTTPSPRNNKVKVKAVKASSPKQSLSPRNAFGFSNTPSSRNIKEKVVAKVKTVKTPKFLSGYPSMLVSPRNKPPMSPRIPTPSKGKTTPRGSSGKTPRGDKVVHKEQSQESPFFSEDNADNDGNDASGRMSSPVVNKPPTTPRQKTPPSNKTPSSNKAPKTQMQNQNLQKGTTSDHHSNASRKSGDLVPTTKTSSAQNNRRRSDEYLAAVNRKENNKGREDTNNNEVAERNAANEMMMASIHCKEGEELSSLSVQQDEVNVQLKEVETARKDELTPPQSQGDQFLQNLGIAQHNSGGDHLVIPTSTTSSAQNKNAMNEIMMECTKMNSHDGNENEEEEEELLSSAVQHDEEDVQSKVVETVEKKEKVNEEKGVASKRAPRGLNVSTQNEVLQPSPPIEYLEGKDDEGVVDYYEDEQQMTTQSMMRVIQTLRANLLAMQQNGAVLPSKQDETTTSKGEQYEKNVANDEIKEEQKHKLVIQPIMTLPPQQCVMTPTSKVMEEAMNFLRTPRGRHILVDSVEYDGSDPFTNLYTSCDNSNDHGNGNDELITDEDCDDELEVAKQLAMALGRFLVDHDADDDGQEADQLEGREEDMMEDSEPMGYDKQFEDSQQMEQFEDRNEDRRNNEPMGFDEFLIDDGQMERCEERNEDTNEDELDESNIELQHSESNDDDWEGWTETPRNDPAADSTTANDDGFSFPVNFNDEKSSDRGFQLAPEAQRVSNGFGAFDETSSDRSFQLTAEGYEDNNGFGSFETSSESHNGGHDMFFPSSFGQEQPANPPAVVKSRPKKSNLSVATSFNASASFDSTKKQPKIKICIDGAPVFKPSTDKKPFGEDMFFIRQPSPSCGDGARLFGGHGSSLLSPTVSEGAADTASVKETMVKSMVMSNRTKKLNLKGFLNGAARPPSRQQRGVPESISAAGLLAVPSNESLGVSHDDNAGYVDNSINKNGSCNNYKISEGQFFAAPATATMDSYPQISVNLNLQRTPPKKKVGGGLLGGSPASFKHQMMNIRSANSGDAGSVSAASGGGSAKKAKNLLRRIKTPLLGRTKRKNTSFGSLNDDNSLPFSD